MEITKEGLEKRLVELRQNREQLIAAVRAHDGALQDVEYWLQVLAKEESKEPTKE